MSLLLLQFASNNFPLKPVIMCYRITKKLLSNINQLDSLPTLNKNPIIKVLFEKDKTHFLEKKNL